MLRNQETTNWAINYVGKEINEINEVTREGVRYVISNAMQYGGHPKETAEDIKNFIGLTKSQIDVLMKYRETLKKQKLSSSEINKRIKLRVTEKIFERALLITRTETIAAANNGQQLHWEEMIRKGFLHREEMIKVWIVTPDDKLCEFCRLLGMTTTEIDGYFEMGIKTPPLHPRCRCAIGLVRRANIL